MEAIQAALDEIIASDDMTASRMSDSQTMSPMLDGSKSPSASMVSLDTRPTPHFRRMASKSVENLRGFEVPHGKDAGKKNDTPLLAARKSLADLSPTPERPSRVLFDDEPSLIPNDDNHTHEDADEPSEGKLEDTIQLAEPGNLQLGTEISRLQSKIQELVKQEHLLETLISQAELTGNQAELRLLRRSQSSVRQETRGCIFQKAQYEQQEEENRLVPGRTRVSIPSHIDTLEDGKQVVRYVVRIEQLDEKQVVGLKWDIARRYNDFHDLDKGIRDWASGTGDKDVQLEIKKIMAELPGKKLVPILSGNQLDTRRSGLERYLQVSTITLLSLISSLLHPQPPCAHRLRSNHFSREDRAAPV
jgi:sorting nexin-25